MTRRRLAFVLVAAILATFAPPAAADDADKWASTYAAAIQKINEAHARSPGKETEKDLAARLPADAKAAFSRLVEAKGSPAVFEALVRCGEAALDLDLAGDFEKAHARLERDSADHAKRLGRAVSRPRFVVRGLGGLDAAYLKRVADVIDAILVAYDEVFGFEEWSKVPGKKLRFRFHLEAKAEAPPHFGPEFPFHSEVDFPVDDGSAFKSPTPDGRFLFYGLCHELGHVIAMWGDRQNEEDHHAWAHYTGVAIVEHLASKKPAPDVLADLGDVRWRSLEIERKASSGVPPAAATREGVLSLFVALHDAVGPKAIGDAINRLDRKDERLRVNHVRYYGFKALKAALLEGAKDKDTKKAIERLLP